MTTKDFTENFTKLEFEIFGYCGFKRVSLCGNIMERDGIVIYHIDDGLEKTLEISPERKQYFLETLFDKVGVMDYKTEYKNHNQLLDGERWSLHIEFCNRKAKNSGGYMAYPENYDDLLRALSIIDETFERFFDTEEESPVY